MTNQNVYIIAVSGGVDSVVLLHKLMSVKPDKIKYVVAHFDHGIRKDSEADSKFVKDLSKKYELEFKLGKGKLGAKSSEAEARDARYAFLERVAIDEEAEAIITAHHQDDVLETMIVNILRGTGPKGLIGFTKRGILRPLIHKTKSELVKYANDNDLKWRDDPTNQDEKYLRNYVRINLIPKLSKQALKLLEIRNNLSEKYIEIEDLTKNFLVQTAKDGKLVRSRFVVLPYLIQKEMMASLLRLNGVEIDRTMIEKAVISAKTLPVGKHVELAKNVKLYSEKSSLRLLIE